MSIYRGRNRRDFYLSSLLYDSIDDNNLSAVIKLLCDKGADPNLVMPNKGISPFHLAIGCDSTDFSQEVTRLILQNGGDPNVRSDDGLTPVHIAAAWKRLEILKLLLDCGGNAEARDANSMSPFHYAKKEGFNEGLDLISSYLTSNSDVMKQETKDCYKLILDKICIDNGFEIGTYKIVSEYNPHSIKIEPLQKLESLPKSDPKEYVLNWFNTHIDDVGGNTYVKIPKTSIVSTDSDEVLSFESSIDESDNENQRIAKMLNITFRKLYRKKRNISKKANSPSKSNFIGETEAISITRNDVIDTSSKVEEYSSESGIVTLPNSKEELENNQNFNNVPLHMIDFEALQKCDSNIHFEKPAKLEKDCSGYKSYNNEKTDEVFTSYELSHSPKKNETSIQNAPKVGEDDDTSSSNKYQSICKKSSNSSEYLTCSVNSLMEKNIFTVTEDMNKEEFSDKSRSIKSVASMNAKSEGIGSIDMSFVSISEVYKYEDQDEGIVLYERRLMKTPSEFNGSSKTGSTSSKLSSLPDAMDYNAESLRQELTLLGYNPGPITATTQRVYLKKLYQLKKHPVLVLDTQRQASKRVYSVELERTLRSSDWTNNLALYKSYEESMQRQFSIPDPSKKWREGISKSSFTYLLLDPRKTNNLPGRMEILDKQYIWETFLSAIFYIGKGKRSRPYSHLYDAVSLWKQGIYDSNSDKLQTILDIWKSNGGVICLHVFQNIIPVEAYTREAAMINALKIENLTNAKPGDFYGIAGTWNERQKRMLGVYLLYKAMNIFLNEGEKHLYPCDIE